MILGILIAMFVATTAGLTDHADGHLKETFHLLQSHCVSVRQNQTASLSDFDYPLLDRFYNLSYHGIRPVLIQLTQSNATTDEPLLDTDIQDILTKAFAEQMGLVVNVSTNIQALIPELAKRAPLQLDLPPDLGSLAETANAGLNQFVAYIECLNQDKCYRSVQDRHDQLNATCRFARRGYAKHLCTADHSNATRDQVRASLIAPVVHVFLPLCHSLMNPSASTQTSCHEEAVTVPSMEVTAELQGPFDRLMQAVERPSPAVFEAIKKHMEDLFSYLQIACRPLAMTSVARDLGLKLMTDVDPEIRSGYSRLRSAMAYSAELSTFPRTRCSTINQENVAVRLLLRRNLLQFYPTEMCSINTALIACTKIHLRLEMMFRSHWSCGYDLVLPLQGLLSTLNYARTKCNNSESGAVLPATPRTIYERRPVNIGQAARELIQCCQEAGSTTCEPLCKHIDQNTFLGIKESCSRFMEKTLYPCARKDLATSGVELCCDARVSVYCRNVCKVLLVEGNDQKITEDQKKVCSFSINKFRNCAVENKVKLVPKRNHLDYDELGK